MASLDARRSAGCYRGEFVIVALPERRWLCNWLGCRRRATVKVLRNGRWQYLCNPHKRELIDKELWGGR